MADISPFAGLRYATERVGDLARVLCPPYDVIGEEGRRELESRHPENIVRLELPRGNDDTRYTTAARLLGSWTTEGILKPEARDAFYLYEQQFSHAGQRYTRRGFFAAVRLEPFERRVVLPHEKTLSAPKEDRRRLLRATRTQISPVFGLYRDAGGAARAIIDEAADAPAAIDATTADGVRHRLWPMTSAAALDGAFDVEHGDETTAQEIEERLTRQGAEANRVVFAVRAPGRPSTVWLSLKKILDLSALGPPALRSLDVTVLHGVILGPLLA